MKKKVFLIVACLSMLTLSGCKKDKETICTTVYPIQYLVERIGGAYVNVCNISSNDTIQISHIKKDFKKQLKNANTFLYISGIEPYFDIYIDDIRNSKTNYIDLSSKVFFHRFARNSYVFNDGKKTIVDQPYYEGNVFDNINTYTNDPFIWMDPIEMIAVSELIRDYLIELYPEYKRQITENYEEVERDLTILDSNYQLLKDENRKISFVSMTPSFGNWQTAFNFQVYPVVLSKYGALPNKEQLNIIKQKIKDDGVRYIANEQNLNKEMNDLYEKLVEELNLIPVNLSNVSLLTEKQRTEYRDYITIMYDNLKILEDLEE